MAPVKYGLIKYSTNNIGDDIQSIAARDLFPKIDKFFDRDNISNYNVSESAKIILNGWYSECPENWPPPKELKPLITSFHLTHKNKSAEILLNGANIQYLKKHEPIGCRDYWTLNKLKEKGVKSYFSGCLTLTLEKKSFKKNNKILFVDPFLNMPKTFDNYFFNNHIPTNIINRIERISHWDENLSKNTSNRIKIAENLLIKYSEASLVITSRLHCALPCLAIGTPVYFINHGYNSVLERNRFEGLFDLMDLINVDNSMWRKVIKKLFKNKNLLFKYYANSIVNQLDWEKQENMKNQKVKEIRKRLKQIVSDFL